MAPPTSSHAAPPEVPTGGWRPRPGRGAGPPAV